VIVLDLMMLITQGWQFATEHRARDEEIPIVLLRAARDLRTYAKALSAAEIIEKPFDLSELLPTIARVASAAQTSWPQRARPPKNGPLGRSLAEVAVTLMTTDSTTGDFFFRS
jgi:DNA-binding response OmpR family regulator